MLVPPPPPPPLLLITIVPTDPAVAVATTDEGVDAAAAATEDDDDVLPDGNEQGATLPDDHDVCLTTITPGRHCWWCWRICDAVCWAEEVADGEGLQLPAAASATVGVIDTDTIAGGLPLGLLTMLLEGMLEDAEEEEVVEEAGGQVAPAGGVRNLRYGSS